TCCPDTASEHRMFFKLMLDTLETWAKEYRVDGFRFDLMSFSFKDNMLEIKRALHEIDPTIYLYGEGWNFGEVANNALGINATQPNMAGTGIGTFSDRGRDAIRGGGPFDGGLSLVANQGFINGLWYDDNGASPLFRLQTGDEVKQRVKFHNVGPTQQPALIVMAISDKVGRKLDPSAKSIVVLFNADKISKTITVSDYAGIPLKLHPVLQHSFADPSARQSQYDSKSGAFSVPERTTAVFVEKR